MYIYQRISYDGSSWRSKSIDTESLFDEDPYRNQTLPGKEVRFTHEPVDGDYDRLCEALSGEIVTYHLGESRDVFSGKDTYTKILGRR